VIPFLVLGVLVFFTDHKKNMSNGISLSERPEPFTSNQKTTLVLIALMMGIVLAAPLLHIAFPDNKTITFVNSKMDIGLVASVFVVIALLLKLGDEKKVVAMVPWGTLIMICGVGMLISVAIQAGTVKLLASWIGASLPPYMVPVAMCVVAAIFQVRSALSRQRCFPWCRHWRRPAASIRCCCSSSSSSARRPPRSRPSLREAASYSGRARRTTGGTNCSRNCCSAPCRSASLRPWPCAAD